MLWSIDSCQNRVSTDQYHLTASQAQESTHRGRVFFDVIRWQVTSFQLIAGSSKLFKLCMKYVVFMSLWLRTIKILMSNGPRTQKFSQLFKNTGGENLFFPWSRSTSNFYPLIGQNLTVRAENLCRILKLVYFDRWSFLSTFDVFNCLSPLNDIQWHTM